MSEKPTPQGSGIGTPFGGRTIHQHFQLGGCQNCIAACTQVGPGAYHSMVFPPQQAHWEIRGYIRQQEGHLMLDPSPCYSNAPVVVYNKAVDYFSHLNMFSSLALCSQTPCLCAHHQIKLVGRYSISETPILTDRAGCYYKGHRIEYSHLSSSTAASHIASPIAGTLLLEQHCTQCASLKSLASTRTALRFAEIGLRIHVRPLRERHFP